MKVVPLFSVLILFCITFRISITSENVYTDCLRLTPYIRNGSVNIAQNLAEVDSSKFMNITSYAGFITVNDEYDSNLFFWFFPKPQMSTTPLIIWLQGGPGYSSLKGLFDIMGPFEVEGDKVIQRPITWASDYSLLFLDQPVGAGYSFTQNDRGYTDNEDDVGEQMHEFLVQFLELFPELKEAPLFIAGESYAGKYVPALAIQIHRRKDKHPINLRGIAIGNGLIDPLSMMHYSEFSRILGLLDDTQVEVLKIIEQDTVQAIQEERMLDAALGFNKTLEYIKKHSGVSFYNFNMDQGGGAPAFEAFVNRADVREAIHVGNASYHLNNQLVYQKMQPDMMNTTKPFVEELLEHYGVMCYSGQLDVILPYGLSRNLYSKLNWSRRPEYIKASRRRLRNATDGTIVAYKKSGGNFAEVLIRRAGHMVPEEQPDVAKFIIDRFIEEYK
ncbi:venom serine carboxypeptidase-like [Zerene cesonia]|uniref:venom serine carboxypeptidase-like n=1 Tax=Zerene cesonia TaxID=33412 RepID=UPI0018E530E6|nr:venom serine carboxypeptidase-like [Zerene cesonia]